MKTLSNSPDANKTEPRASARAVSRRHSSSVCRNLAAFALFLALGNLPALGQPVFSSGSDGSDGALDLTGQSGEVIFDPVALGIDLDGDNVFHFTTITIPPGVSLRLRGLELQFAPVYWLAQGAVQIDGTVDVSGEAGHDDQLGNRRPSMPGPGGFPGGVGSTPDSPAQPGLGPGGGPINGSGIHSQLTGCIGSEPRPYGNLFLLPLTGGSGGGGKNNGTGGGAGGGALLIASSDSIRVGGSVRSNGGNNGTPSSHCSVGAGGGLRLLAPVLSGNGSISADKGRLMGGGNTSGSQGRIRIETFQNDFAGSIVGVSRIATLSPNAIILPASLTIPSIRVTQIAGIDVPPAPSGSFLDPDVTIDSSTPVDLTIEATNVPIDAGLKLNLYPETGPDIIVAPQLVSGDESASTWSASATFPNGFSRTFVYATWTP